VAKGFIAEFSDLKLFMICRVVLNPTVLMLKKVIVNCFKVYAMIIFNLVTFLSFV